MTIDAHGAHHARDGKYTGHDRTAAADGVLPRYNPVDDALQEVAVAEREFATAESRVSRAHIAAVDALVREAHPSADKLIVHVHYDGDAGVAKVANRDGRELRPFRPYLAAPTNFDVAIREHLEAIPGDIDGWLTRIDPTSRVAEVLGGRRYYELDLDVTPRTLYDVEPVTPHTSGA
jgi:hypothetical protein